MYALELKNVSHAFGENKVLQNINLQIAAGQIVGLVGPSGCGKSTLLHAILGTHPPQRGEVLAEGQAVTGPTRHVGIVYQHYSLYDFLTAEKNVAFGLMLDETSILYRTLHDLAWPIRRLAELAGVQLLRDGWHDLRQQHLRQAREFLEKVDLQQAVHLYPSQMSGGMKQRVAIAQALIMEPKVLLLDEPFGALDEATRQELQFILLHLYHENLQAKAEGRRPPYTILIVTHELNEAIYVSDRVLGLSRYHTDGHDGATIVYDKPCPVFHPDDPRDFSQFIQQREELRRAVFDEEYIKHYSKYVTFWRDVQRQAHGWAT